MLLGAKELKKLQPHKVDGRLQPGCISGYATLTQQIEDLKTKIHDKKFEVSVYQDEFGSDISDRFTGDIDHMICKCAELCIAERATIELDGFIAGIVTALKLEYIGDGAKNLISEYDGFLCNHDNSSFYWLPTSNTFTGRGKKLPTDWFKRHKEPGRSSIGILKTLRHYRSNGYELSIKIVFYGGSSDFEDYVLVVKSSFGPKRIDIQTEFSHCVPVHDGRTDYEYAQYMYVCNIIRKLAEEFFTEERKCEFAEFKCSDEVWEAVVEHIDRDTDLKDDEK